MAAAVPTATVLEALPLAAATPTAMTWVTAAVTLTMCVLQVTFTLVRSKDRF